MMFQSIFNLTVFGSVAIFVFYKSSQWKEQRLFNIYLGHYDLIEFKPLFDRADIKTAEKCVRVVIVDHPVFGELSDAAIMSIEESQRKLKDALILQQWLEDKQFDYLLEKLHSNGIWTFQDLVSTIPSYARGQSDLGLSVDQFQVFRNEVIKSNAEDHHLDFSTFRKVYNYMWWLIVSFCNRGLPLFIGGSLFLWLRGNRQAARQSVDHSASYFQLLTGSLLDPFKATVNWGWEDMSQVGCVMKFSVQFYQRNGFKYPISEADSFSVEILSPQGPIPFTVDYGKDKNYNEVHVHAFTVKRSGDYAISIRVGLSHIKGSPFRKQFLAGLPDPKRTIFIRHSSTVVCAQGQLHPLLIECRDGYDNICSVESLDRGEVYEHFDFKLSSKIGGETLVDFNPYFKFVPVSKSNCISLMLNVKDTGCYRATTSFQGEPLKNGVFNLLVLSCADSDKVARNIKKKNGDTYYESILLSCNREKLRKSKKVYCYISPKQLTIKEFYLKVIPKRLFTFRVCPATKFHFLGSYEHNEELEEFIIDDGGQPPVTLASKDRDLLAATFTKFLLSNIGGSELFKDKQHCFYQEVCKLHSRKRNPVVLFIERDNLVESSMKATKHLSTSDWCKKFEIHFMGEEGLDWGGLTREWVQLLCNTFFGSEGQLFKSCQEDNVQGLVHPNPDRPAHFQKLKYFEFAGKLVGKCLYDSSLGSASKLYVKAKFTRSFLAQLIGLRITHQFFETDDPEFYTSKVKYILDNDIDALELTFSEEQYDKQGQLIQIIELIPGGTKIEVTNENKVQYLDLLAQHRLVNKVQSEVETFLKGLNDLIPDNLLSIFDENELEMLLCGASNFSVSDLQSNHIVVGTNPRFLKTVEWFWTVLYSLTQEDLARLLQFTTGSSQLPPGGFSELRPPFQIMSVPLHAILPTAHTCFNQLCLPTYDNAEQLHKSLILAITEGSEGFGII